MSVDYVAKCRNCGHSIGCEQSDLIQDWGPGDFIEPELVGYVICPSCGKRINYRLWNRLSESEKARLKDKEASRNGD